MRDLFTVLPEMLKVIPAELDIREPLIELLNYIKQHNSYTPPECMEGAWHRLTQIINMHIVPPLTDEWEFKLISILTTKSVEQLKAEQQPF